MATTKKVNQSALLTKKVFDLCEKAGDGIHGPFHLIKSLDDSRLSEDETKVEWRGYHADGFCFLVTKEPSYTDERSVNYDEIDGFEYDFFGDEFKGFRVITKETAIELLKKVKR